MATKKYIETACSQLEMKVGDKTYRKVKGHYETVPDGSGRVTWVTWELVK